MKKVYVHWSDGIYWLTEEGCPEDAMEIDEEVWEQYLAHCDADRWWNVAIGALDNACYERKERHG